jgi:cholera toxin transcriptional activator
MALCAAKPYLAGEEHCYSELAILIGMESSTRPLAPQIRFGIYEVDLRAGELRRQGLKIKLQQQPFQFLAMLLECPGAVITRQEVQKKLWPMGTFVDFDRGLNRAINRLREALSDSADSPRFVETIPRRGYRFIAPVEKFGMRTGLTSGEPPRIESLAVLPL